MVRSAALLNVSPWQVLPRRIARRRVRNDSAGVQLPRLFASSPAASCFERFSCFEEALETRQDVRPSARNCLDKLRVGLIDLVDDGELDRLVLLFEFMGQARKSLGPQLRFEFVAPRLSWWAG